MSSVKPTFNHRHTLCKTTRICLCNGDPVVTTCVVRSDRKTETSGWKQRLLKSKSWNQICVKLHDLKQSAKRIYAISFIMALASELVVLYECSIYGSGIWLFVVLSKYNLLDKTEKV